MYAFPPPRGKIILFSFIVRRSTTFTFCLTRTEHHTHAHIRINTHAPSSHIAGGDEKADDDDDDDHDDDVNSHHMYTKKKTGKLMTTFPYLFSMLHNILISKNRYLNLLISANKKIRAMSKMYNQSKARRKIIKIDNLRLK